MAMPMRINLFRELNRQTQRSISHSAVNGLVNKKFQDAGLPLPPKAPSSSYAHFFTDLYPKIREQHLNGEGKVDSRAVAKVAGQKWNELSEEEKKPYVQKGKAASEAYKTAYAKYYNALTPTELKGLNAILPRPLQDPNLPKTTASGSKIRYNSRHPQKAGEPQRPIGGFFVFMREVRQDASLLKQAESEGIAKGQLQVWLSKKGGEKWATMSASEKEKFGDQAASIKSDHDAWKASADQV